MDWLLKATYTRGEIDSVKVTFWDDGTADYVAAGEIDDFEIDEIIAAEGGDVTGWSGKIFLE